MAYNSNSTFRKKKEAILEGVIQCQYRNICTFSCRECDSYHWEVMKCQMKGEKRRAAQKKIELRLAEQKRRGINA